MPTRTNNPAQTRIVDPTSQRSRTATHLSTNIIILVNGMTVAAVKSLQITEQRSIKMVDEVGNDGSIDSAPSSSTKISGTCNRTRFDKQRIAEAFMRGFVHIAAQRIPFDLEIQDNFAGAGDESVIITTLRNVWFERINYTYSADEFIIAEDCSFVAESIDSILGSGGPVVGAVNNRGIPIEVNPFERQADMGLFRGSLDAAGILNAFDGPGGRSL